MRSNEQRIVALHKRAAELKRSSMLLRARVFGAVSVACSFALLILLVNWMPGAADILAAGEPSGMSGSIFSENGVLGYLVTALIAFLLGISVTMFCFCLKKRQGKQGDEDQL